MATIDKKMQILRQMYVGIAEAIEALQRVDKYESQIKTLKDTVKSQEHKIGDLLTINGAYEKITQVRIKVCPECLGAGAYVINGDLEECDKCDTNGWIEL